MSQQGHLLDRSNPPPASPSVDDVNVTEFRHVYDRLLFRQVHLRPFVLFKPLLLSLVYVRRYEYLCIVKDIENSIRSAIRIPIADIPDVNLLSRVA